jgi:hypothetical protein
MTKFLLRTQVIRRKGSNRQFVLAANGIQPIADPVRLSVVEAGDGNYFLFREDDAGDCLADTWHETIEDAKRTADNEYETTGWRESP